jgi:hypothetical protein
LWAAEIIAFFARLTKTKFNILVTGEWRKLHNEEDGMGGSWSTNGGEEERV